MERIPILLMIQKQKQFFQLLTKTFQDFQMENTQQLVLLHLILINEI